jgi:hypothetical protein
MLLGYATATTVLSPGRYRAPTALDGPGARVRLRNTPVTRRLNSHPRIAAEGTSPTSRTNELANTQSTFTRRVFEAASPTTYTSTATAANA